MGVDYSEIARLMEVSAMLFYAHTVFLLFTAVVSELFYFNRGQQPHLSRETKSVKQIH